MDASQDPQPNHGLDPSPIHEPLPIPPPEQGIGPWLVRNGVYVVVVLALFLWFCIKQDFDTTKILALFKAALGLGLVIFIHELGHFLVAKWCDVHVETFSIGFGPPIPGCVFRRGETTYMIALFPLGGYVKMVGEGPEEEAEDDPRSFKNKPVWQRMAIISAGVTMNVALAFACFVFVFLTHGVERAPGVVDRIEPGSPAWKEGMRSGDVVYWIGNKGPRPYFNDIRPIIVNSRKDEPLKLVFGPPGLSEEKWNRVSIVPRKEKDDTRPVIGVQPPSALTLLPRKYKKVHEIPAIYDSAAARATPPLEFGDAIIGTTDLDHPNNPDQILPLPLDPRCIPPDPEHLDYFEFERRMHRLAGKEIVLQVRRQTSGEPILIHVPPAYVRTPGLRMAMGKIVAIRDGSPAAKAGLDPDRFDYYIEKVQMADASGRTFRYPEDLTDPVQLPDALERWAAAAISPKKAILTLTKAQVNPSASALEPGNHPAQEKLTVPFLWEDGWEPSKDVEPLPSSSPLAIEGLGIAYRVLTTVESVQPGGPADQTGIRKDDKVLAVRFYKPGKTKNDKAEPLTKWKELKSDQGAYVFKQLQSLDVPKVDLKIERGETAQEITVTAIEDRNWPRADRGLLFQPDFRLQKADNFGQAISLGVAETIDFTQQIFGNLLAIVSGRVSVNEMGGPLTIGYMAFEIAGDDFYHFLIFLGIIGVNLAVINFLPIPVLDGGHMVFLIYEWIRGKPAPETVRIATTYVGLALIASLMILVIYLDVKKVF